LREVDNIVVLGENGTVIEQGTFASLDLQGGYVQSLIIEAQAKKPQSHSTSDALENARDDRDTTAVRDTEAEDDLLRKTGDMTLYKYYLKSVGWKDGITILLLTLSARFCLYFPREH
jgi:ATP-binding cassette subfamily C (CFTR/MRP) protein 1